MDFDPILTDATYWGIESRRINLDFLKLWAALESYSPQTLNPVLSVNQILPDLSGNVTITAQIIGAVSIDEKGEPEGVVPLDENAKIDPVYLPSNLGEGALFLGWAIPSTNPLKGFYFAQTPGTYVNFSSQQSIPIEISEAEFDSGYIILFFSQNGWTKLILPYPDIEQLTSIDWENIDNKPEFKQICFSASFNDLEDVPDFIERSEKNNPGGVAGLDEHGLIYESQIPAKLFNKAAYLFGGFISTSDNPALIIANTSSKLFFLPEQQGTYTNFGGLQVTEQELKDYIVVFLYDRTQYTKKLYHYSSSQIVQAPVISVNNKVGAVVLTAEDVGAIPLDEKGEPEGVVPLNPEGKIDEHFLPFQQVTASIRYKGLATTETQFGESSGFYFASEYGDYNATEDGLQFFITKRELIDNIITIFEIEDSSEIKSIWTPLPGLDALYKYNTNSVTDLEEMDLEKSLEIMDSIIIRKFKYPLKDNTIYSILADESNEALKQDEERIDLASWLGVLTAYVKYFNLPYILNSVVTLLENPPQALQVQYSIDAINWHFPYRTTDVWRREKIGNSDWSAPMFMGSQDYMGTQIVSSILEPTLRDDDFWFQIL